MLFKKNTLILTLSLSIISIAGNAQSDKIFHNLGFSAFTSGFHTPASFGSFSEYDSLNAYGSTSGFGFIGMEYTFRYTLWEASDNFSVGANLSPHLSVQTVDSYVGVGDGGVAGALSIPVYVSANFGEGATYNGIGNRGGYIGLGYEFMKIFAASEPRTNVTTGESFDPVLGYGLFKIAAGYRWWSKNDRLKELSFKYGMGSKPKELGPNERYYDTVKRPLSWTLTYCWFLNY